MFLLRLKGQVEENIANIDYEKYCVYRPGLLIGRDDMRTIEKVLNWVPFMPKIDAKHLGKVMLEHAI
jgi:hypothetical protein